mgnify:CR=1 FL=1
MTREEAIKWLEETIQDTDTYWESCSEALQKELDEQKEVILLALTALRPVSREMVERVRGEWMFPIFADQKDANDPRCQCSECGSIETPLARHRFCPSCGAPMTDEAVEMVMERLEALKDE